MAVLTFGQILSSSFGVMALSKEHMLGGGEGEGHSVLQTLALVTYVLLSNLQTN